MKNQAQKDLGSKSLLKTRTATGADSLSGHILTFPFKKKLS